MKIRCLLLLVSFYLSSMVAAQYSTMNQHYAVYEPAGSSVLASGMWYKIKIKESGIYRLTYEDIVSMGLPNPQDVRIFGNGGAMLPLMNNIPRYDDLIENSIYMNTGDDTNFGPGDYILFYGQGPVIWTYNPLTSMFEHQMHSFSTYTYYFITTETGTGRKIVPELVVNGTPSLEINSFDDFSFHERNRYNFIESGRQWFGEEIDYAPFDSVFHFSGLLTNAPVKIKVNATSRSESTRSFALYSGISLLGTISLPSVVLKNKTSTYAHQKSGIFSLMASGDEIPLKLTYNKINSEDEGHLDYIIVNTRCQLSLSKDALFFRDQSTAGLDAIARYTVNNCTQRTEIWDITDPFDIKKVSAVFSGNTLTFTDSTNSLKEYVAVNTDAAFPKPLFSSSDGGVGVIANQNLHGTGPLQMLIVSHPLFIEFADSIAELHRTKDNLTVMVVTTDQIYNEFSSGSPDVSAIRDFARMIYSRGTGDHNTLKYLLLMGDGSYNNISESQGNSNFMITYQSENSLNAADSYVTDDFFGMMGEDEGGSTLMGNYTMDLGVGRLPAKTEDEARSLYRKIKYYNTYKNKGDWQNNILFAGDDEDGNEHMRQANDLAAYVDSEYPQFAIKKVMLDAYKQVSSSSGTRYPDANRAIINNIEKGLLIFNYTGHGGEIGLADEQILLRDDLTKMTNIDRLPLFITATCEFSRFDDLTRDENGILTESTSAGELSILNPNGGSIALISTTRIVWSLENFELNDQFYHIAFQKDAQGNHYALGDIMKLTKNALGSSQNKLNFILLGDPALKLATPRYSIVTDSVNHISVNESVDTLKAFSHITVTGHIVDNDNSMIETFNGVIYPSVFDKSKTLTTLANDVNTVPMNFTTREDLLYKGKASVVNGRFSFEFLVPKDITYNYGHGRITYFSYNTDVDANGEFSNFVIGGTDKTAEIDLNGPDISLFLNDELFNNLGITNPNPVIFAKVKDESGINTIGNGIGHDITGVIDDNVSHPVVMNDYFETDLDDYTSGVLRYPMENLEEGWHSLKVKIWDVYNNSSEQIIEFKVIAGNKIMMTKAGNYPNPAKDYTTFIFEHNKPDEELTVTISVYDMQGRILFDFISNIYTSGFNSSPPLWDLRDMNGNQLKQGIYPYRIRVSDSNGSYSDSYQKLVVVR